MQTEKTIDLGVARTHDGVEVFAGRKRGAFWRKRFGLDQLDNGVETIRVIIPRDILSLNISFFLNLFGDSVRKLGREGFRERYHFVCDTLLEPHIAKGIDQALKRSSALPE